MKKKETKKADIYPYPSTCGSHATMVNAAASEKLTNADLVVCEDANGLYVTEKTRLDDRCADPYRCATREWREQLLQSSIGKV